MLSRQRASLEKTDCFFGGDESSCLSLWDNKSYASTLQLCCLFSTWVMENRFYELVVLCGHTWTINFPQLSSMALLIWTLSVLPLLFLLLRLPLPPRTLWPHCFQNMYTSQCEFGWWLLCFSSALLLCFSFERKSYIGLIMGKKTHIIVDHVDTLSSNRQSSFV